jgi:hypothetical protein
MILMSSVVNVYEFSKPEHNIENNEEYSYVDQIDRLTSRGIFLLTQAA